MWGVRNVPLSLKVRSISCGTSWIDCRGLTGGTVGIDLLLVQHFHFLSVILVLNISLGSLIVGSHAVLVISSLTADILDTGWVVSRPLRHLVVLLHVIDFPGFWMMSTSIVLILLIGAVSFTLLLAHLLGRRQRHGWQMKAAVLGLVEHHVCPESSTRYVTCFSLITLVMDWSTLPSLSVGCAASYRTSICSHHSSDIDWAMMCVALPSAHDIAVFILAASSIYSLILGHDSAAEVPDGVSRSSDFGHFNRASASRRILFHSRIWRSTSNLHILPSLFATYIARGATCCWIHNGISIHVSCISFSNNRTLAWIPLRLYILQSLIFKCWRFLTTSPLMLIRNSIWIFSRARIHGRLLIAVRIIGHFRSSALTWRLASTELDIVLVLHVPILWIFKLLVTYQMAGSNGPEAILVLLLNEM